MVATGLPVTAGMSRVWITENGVGPDRTVEYFGCAVIGDSTFNVGEKTRIECPDDKSYNAFQQVGSVPGARERPTTSLRARYDVERSDFLRLTRKGCRLDAYVLIGACKNPQDFVNGWQKIRYYPDGHFSSWSDENAGALGSDENNPTNESVDMSSEDIIEFMPLMFSELADTEAAREVIAGSVCDHLNCGDCGQPSDGCEKVLAVMIGAGATPGTLPSVLYSDDNGITWATTDIDTMFSPELPADATCVSDYYVVVSNTSNSMHLADVSDIFDGTEIWFEVNDGFVAGGEPNAIWSVDASHTWVVGDGGYVYFAASVAAGVVVQDPGVATTRDLADIHAFDTKNALAVGAFNSVIYTTNGGEIWDSVVGPSVGVGLIACWMYSPTYWFVSDAIGGFFYTDDAGLTWPTVPDFPGQVDRVDVIEFVDEAEGFAAVRIGTDGGIMRTITGGNSWWLLPEGANPAMPINDYLNDLAVCGSGDNIVFGFGLADGAAAGYIVKAE